MHTSSEAPSLDGGGESWLHPQKQTTTATGPMQGIRRAKYKDYAAVQTLLNAAFKPSTFEEKLVGLLWLREKLYAHFVAIDGADIIGYVAYTIALNSKDEFAGIHLAPLAILPKYQKKEIVSELLRTSLAEVAEDRVNVYVLGDPEFYSQFGFKLDPAQRSGFDPEGQAFQVIANNPLQPTELQYEPEFLEAKSLSALAVN